MSDTPISLLPSATLPLSGKELYPIVQSGQTRKVAVADTYLTPQMYGAAGDGVTDDSAAIQSAVAAAVASGHAIFFPAGTYIVTVDGVLSPTSGTQVQVTFLGENWENTIIKWGTLSAPSWFWNDGDHAGFCQFENLQFKGANTVNTNGFQITAATYSQGFRFINCQWNFLNNIFEFDGTDLASEMKFYGCEFSRCSGIVYNINNSQSFNHEFFGCDFTLIGNVFNIGANGGGAIKVFGGSVIMSASGGPFYFFNADASTGPGAFPFTFNGMRVELRGTNTNLLFIDEFAQLFVAFNDCLFEDQSTVAKADWCDVGTYGNATFNRCTFYEINASGIMHFVGIGAVDYGQSGAITFDTCVLPNGWSDRCSLNAGSIVARNTIPGAVGAVSGAHNAHDFNLHANTTIGLLANWPGSGNVGDGSGNDLSWPVKTAQIKLAYELWPTDEEVTLFLPANAIIRNVYIGRPPGGSSITTQMRVTNNDKSVVHAITNSANQSTTALVAAVKDYFYNVGTTTTERTLRLSSTVNTTGSFRTGGYCFVEYI